MEYKITIDNFEGPMDLLLHLIKQSDIDIADINIADITKQYLTYIEVQDQMNLNVASEYLVMASTLIEMKSSMLLPKRKVEVENEEEDPRELLIRRLIEYKRYKEMVSEFKSLEEERNHIYTKAPEDLKEYQESDTTYSGEVGLDDLLKAFQSFIDRKEMEKPLATKVTKRELSVSTRSREIKDLLKFKKKLEFYELFEIYNKEYVIVTFLSILDLAKKQELDIKQEDNFSKIFLLSKGGD